MPTLPKSLHPDKMQGPRGSGRRPGCQRSERGAFRRISPLPRAQAALKHDTDQQTPHHKLVNTQCDCLPPGQMLSDS